MAPTDPGLVNVVMPPGCCENCPGRDDAGRPIGLIGLIPPSGVNAGGADGPTVLPGWGTGAPIDSGEGAARLEPARNGLTVPAPLAGRSLVETLSVTKLPSGPKGCLVIFVVWIPSGRIKGRSALSESSAERRSTDVLVGPVAVRKGVLVLAVLEERNERF